MKNLLPVLLVMIVLVGGAFAIAAWVVLVSSGSCSSSAKSVGVVLVYEIDPEYLRDRPWVDVQELLPEVIAAIDRRVNLRWRRAARVQQRDDGRIEVAVFASDPETVLRIESLLTWTGTLEFRILANRLDHKDLIERAESETGNRVLKDEQGNVVAWWVPVKRGEEGSFRWAGADEEIASRKTKRDGRETLEILVVKDPFNVTGAYLDTAQSGVDQRTGRPCIEFFFSAQGARLFGGLTGSNLPDPMLDFSRKLGIILNGELRSAPAVQTTIYERGQITGSFTQQEVESLVTVLNSGPLPAPIRKVQKQTIGEPP